jgi:hypothetical protein
MKRNRIVEYYVNKYCTDTNAYCMDRDKYNR